MVSCLSLLYQHYEYSGANIYANTNCRLAELLNLTPMVNLHTYAPKCGIIPLVFFLLTFRFNRKFETVNASENLKK